MISLRLELCVRTKVLNLNLEFLNEKMELCAQNLSALGQEKSKEKDQKPESTHCLLGKNTVSTCTGEPATLGALQANPSFSSLPHRCRGSEPQFSPDLESPSPGAEDSLLFAPAYAIRTARSLRAHWNCKMCVLKIQSQLVLQDFMLQTLKTLNNNILSAFYVAPVNPEGLKALQKLYVVVAVRKLRNHCLSCLQEAEM